MIRRKPSVTAGDRNPSCRPARHQSLQWRRYPDKVGDRKARCSRTGYDNKQSASCAPMFRAKQRRHVQSFISRTGLPNHSGAMISTLSDSDVTSVPTFRTCHFRRGGTRLKSEVTGSEKCVQESGYSEAARILAWDPNVPIHSSVTLPSNWINFAHHERRRQQFLRNAEDPEDRYFNLFISLHVLCVSPILSSLTS